MSSSPRTLKPLFVFTAAFFLLWTLAVLIVWKQSALPETMQPVFRVIFWGGSAILWLLATRTSRPLKWLGLTPLSPMVIGSTVLAFAAIIAWNLLRVQFTSPPVHMPVLGAGTVWGFIGVASEELVFRGVIQTALTERPQPWVAILVAGLLFVAIHIPGWVILDILPDPATIASVLVIGLVCGALRYWTRSLWPAIGAHWANNLGATL